MMQIMDDTYTIVAQFESLSEAEAAGAAIRGWLAAQDISTEPVHMADKLVFVVGREPDRATIRKIRRQLQGQGGKILLEQTTEEKAITLFMTCLAPDDSTAQRINTEMSDYFHAVFYLGPKAPWESEEEAAQDLTESEARTKATLELVYDSWRTIPYTERIRNINHNTIGNPLKLLLILLSKKRQERLNQEMQQTIFGALEEQVKQKAAESGVELDETLIRDQFAQRDVMSLVARNFQPRPKQALTGYGGMEREGRQLKFDFVMFHRFAYGFPALLGYLRDQGCTAIDYRLEDFDDVRED